MRSRYDLMRRSETEVDEAGEYYFDPLSFPLTKFRVTKSPLEHFLTSSDISRIDLLMFKAYNSPVYDDIIMWLNNLGILDDIEEGQKMLLPEKVDIDDFYLKFRQ